MSKGALKELFHANLEKFNIMIKNVPASEKPEILQFFKEKNTLMENLK